MKILKKLCKENLVWENCQKNDSVKKTINFFDWTVNNSAIFIHCTYTVYIYTVYTKCKEVWSHRQRGNEDLNAGWTGAAVL